MCHSLVLHPYSEYRKDSMSCVCVSIYLIFTFQTPFLKKCSFCRCHWKDLIKVAPRHDDLNPRNPSYTLLTVKTVGTHTIWWQEGINQQHWSGFNSFQLDSAAVATLQPRRLGWIELKDINWNNTRNANSIFAKFFFGMYKILFARNYWLLTWIGMDLNEAQYKCVS